jgi:phenylacetate-CoA ligase
LTASVFADRSRIEADQLAKLRTLLAALVPANAFYSGKLRSAGVGSDVRGLKKFVEALPFTLKPELSEDQQEHPPYGSNLTYPLERYTRFCQTSGTTGKPLRWLDTPESWDWMLDNWAQVFRAAGVSANDRIFFAFSFGPFLGFWLAFECAARMGCLAIPGGGMRSSGRLRTIIDTGATALCCTPTYAMHLAEVAAEEKIDLATAKVKTIIVAGEAGGSIQGTRTHLEKLWRGARVVDHHGMTEIGPVSYGCPERPGVLHVMNPVTSPKSSTRKAEMPFRQEVEVSWCSRIWVAWVRRSCDTGRAIWSSARRNARASAGATSWRSKAESWGGPTIWWWCAA